MGSGQEGPWLEPTGEAQDRETLTHLETHEIVRVGGERAYVA